MLRAGASERLRRSMSSWHRRSGREPQMSIVSAAGATRGASENFNVAVHVLRAFATIMVFCAHMLDSFNTYFFPDYGPLVAAMPYVKRFGTFGVEMFFV